MMLSVRLCVGIGSDVTHKRPTEQRVDFELLQCLRGKKREKIFCVFIGRIEQNSLQHM